MTIITNDIFRSKESIETDEKRIKCVEWIRSQYFSFISDLCTLITTDEEYRALAIRTVMEVRIFYCVFIVGWIFIVFLQFVKVEYKLGEVSSSSFSHLQEIAEGKEAYEFEYNAIVKNDTTFGIHAFQRMIVSLLRVHSSEGISVEILLMLKEEVIKLTICLIWLNALITTLLQPF